MNNEENKNPAVPLYSLLLFNKRMEKNILKMETAEAI
jgi:hypothetical protein